MEANAGAIKEESIRRRPELVEILTRSITSRGGKVFYARTKHDAVEHVRKVCRSRAVKLAVKAHHDSPYGRIVSNGKRVGNPSTGLMSCKLTMEITIPTNTAATGMSRRITLPE